MNNEIIIFDEKNVRLEVNMKGESIWLTQKQMEQLFKKSHSTITDHINNIFREGELDRKSNVGFSDFANSDKPVKIYSLDVIISVGYRVKSKIGTAFRIWANKVLKEHLIKGYTINQKRLDYLEKTVQLIDIANRIENADNTDIKSILNVINRFSKALNLLDDYDHKILTFPKGNKSDKKIEYKECIKIINNLKYNEKSSIFALERISGLNSIINNIYQTFDNKEIYETIEEKGANLLYLIVKDHVFIDGNKRIAAILFIYFLNFYNILYKNNLSLIDNNTLVAITLLIAESKSNEKDMIINLILNFITNSN